LDHTLAALLLTPKARVALEKARDTPLSYGVRMYACPGPKRRLLVVLGEAHMKLGPASRLGKEIVSEFTLRGVETCQRDDVVAGRLLGVLIHAPRQILRVLCLGLVKGSTITDAKAIPTGVTFELEKTDAVPLSLHVASVYLSALFSVLFANLGVGLVRELWPALGGGGLDALAGLLALLSLGFELHFFLLFPALLLRRQPWSFLIHPAIGLVAARDRLMAEGTVRMLAEHPDAAAAVVVMGRAHLPGFEREIVEKHGFARIEL
jgi:hypothetical protein